MSSTDKRAAGVSYCALLMVVIFEGVAIIAALVAITGTFWLGAPSFFSRPTLPPSFADPDLLLRSSGADPLVTAKGSVLPGVKNAGLWRVCYTNPEMPNLLDANTTLEEVMASSETFGLSTVVALGARDAAATDRVASDAPRRAGAPDPDGDRNVNATKFVADIRADLADNLPFSQSLRRCTGDVRLYGDIWGHDFQDKMHATRALTLVFIFCGALKVVYVLLGKVCCGADGGGGSATSPSSRFSRLGRMAGLPVDPHQHLRLGRVAPRRRHRRVQNRSRRGRRRAELLGPLVLALPGRHGSHHARRDIQMLLIAPRKTPSLAEVPRRSRE